MEKSKSITREQAAEMLKQMESINQMNQTVCSNYIAAIEFLGKKGLKAEFEEYLTSLKRVNWSWYLLRKAGANEQNIEW